MREHVETSLEELNRDVEVGLSDNIELSKGKRVVELAQKHLGEEMFIEAQDAVDAGRAHLDQRRKLHGRTEQVHGTVLEELENAETLGVDVSIYESDVVRFRQLYDDKDYPLAIPWGLSLLDRLGNDERSIMDLYIGEVTDLFDSTMDKGGIPKQPIENLDKSLDYFLSKDYIRSYNFIIRAREGIETESRVMTESKTDLERCHQTIVWAEGMGVSVDEARSEFDRGIQLLESSEYTQSLEAAGKGQERAMESVSIAARDTLKLASHRAEEVHESGANAETVLDRVKRGQRSLEQEDYGFALMFAQLALGSANKAEDDLKEAREAIDRVREEVELARRILDDVSQPEAYYSAILESLEARYVTEVIRRSKEAMATIITQERTAVQHRIGKVQDDIRLMEMMELDGSTFEARLTDASDELAAGNFPGAITVIEDVHGPILGLMEDKARTTLEDAKEAVEVMKAIGADDAEVVQGLSQTQDLFAADDFYHSNELSARTAKRSREVSDHTIANIIEDISTLMEDADRLGVETGELDRRVEKVERHRANGRFVEAKEALDDLVKDVDLAQKELVEGIIKTCDELSILVNERDLDAGKGPSLLQEAHHFLSLRDYKRSLETAKDSFAKFEDLFTDVVREILQEAKNLLINLDVSADIESSSDHYVTAEEDLRRRDYTSALANADAAMANARVIQVSIIEEILAAVELELDRGRVLEADMETAADMASRARDELAAENLEEAQTLAMDAREESRGLMQAHASAIIQSTRAAVEAVPFEIEMVDITELLESAASSLDGADYEAATDAAIQSNRILTDRLEAVVKKVIVTAEDDLDRGKEVGIDLSSPKEHLKEAKEHLKEERYLDGREEAKKCSDLVTELVVKHEQAQEALSELMELIERATRARSKLSESMDMQEAAEDAMDEHDYDRVMEMVALAIVDTNRSYEVRVNEAIETAESTLKTLESMGASAKLADDLLNEARKALENGDLDGAYDYSDQSIKEAETAKTSFRDIIDITFQAESLIGTAKGFGMDVSEAQSRFDEALGSRSEDVNRALALAEEAKSIATGLVDSFYPEIELALELESAIVLDTWTNANLMVRNDGSARALRTTIEMKGNLDVDGLSQINILRGSGKVKKMPIRIKPLKSGEIMVRIWIHCEREYDDNPYEFFDVRWLLADEEEGEEEEDAEPGAQFLRKELTCTICQGKIGTQDAPRACSCGATFHQECSDQLSDCPNCSKSLGGA